MELKIIEMGNQIVVTAVPHEVDAYCTFYKINAMEAITRLLS